MTLTSWCVAKAAGVVGSRRAVALAKNESEWRMSVDRELTKGTPPTHSLTIVDSGRDAILCLTLGGCRRWRAAGQLDEGPWLE